ncbi:restriction endonuclease subunit S [Methylomonas sp. MS20]|uniref:restriction endonuclease subunit S n=1 Tax=unclassified Methylomonas TaxID=2608980 RepID=UPI0028A327EB|nr:restriction endonuclease subunit S [Methylomonas sp. MV1]MDT4331371.1 restriction endonuclease subunit S [Methylomonas sp. MV1]
MSSQPTNHAEAVNEASAAYRLQAGKAALRRPGYKMTEVGVIPVDWDAVFLDDVTTHIGDGLHGTPAYSSNGEYFFINGNNLNGGKIIVTTDTKLVDHADFVKYRKPLSDRSILLSINGTVGNLGLYEGEPVVLGKSAAYLNLKPAVSKRFVYHSLQTLIVKRQFFDGLTGSTIGNLGLATIRKTQIPLPPTDTEQRAIAAALSDVDALLDGLERLIAKKRDLKQAAMQQLLTGQTRLAGFSGEWEMKRLTELADIRSGGTPSTAVPQFWDGEIPWSTPTDITALGGRKYLCHTNRMITLRGLKSSSAEMIPAYSIVMTSRATIGECAINTVPVSTNQGFKNFVPFEKTDVEFLYYLLTMQKSGFISLCGGSTFLEIGKAQLAVYQVRLPRTKAEQTAIAAILSDMDAELAALEARRDKTRALKEGMMQELLTGRTRLL